MRSLSNSAMFIGVLSIAASGCSSGNLGLTAVTPPTAAVQRSQHQRSWMQPEASGEDLLYVMDSGLGGIVVYSYTPPKYRLVGLLTNSGLYGSVCVDGAQDVFATGQNVVAEYKHGATSPFRILGGLPGTPQGCTVNPATGMLALPNGTAQKPVVSLFRKAGGKHTNVPVPAPYEITRDCAYDGSGNLFIGAFVAQPSAHFTLLELPNNSKQFVEITLNKSFSSFYTGGIAWDGKYLDIADSAQNIIYQFAINGRKGSAKATIALQRSYDIGSFFVAGTTLIVPAFSKPVAPSQDPPGIVNFYNYPAGGKKTGVIRGVSRPSGVVVSLAKTQSLKR